MKVLLLGAKGQLGTEIANMLSDYEVDQMDRKDFDFESEEPFALSVDQSDNYDVVINSMAFTNTGLCEDQPLKAYYLNSVRVGEIAKQAQKMGATFFHISTDYVFDGNSYASYDEASQVGPLSIYGSSKLAGEYEAQMYCDKCFVLRVSSLYGIHGNNFVKFILEKAAKGESLQVVSDQTMSPTHALDVAKVIRNFIDQKNLDYGVYHSSNVGKCTWSEFAKEFLKLAGFSADFKEVSWKDFPAKLRRPIDSSMSVEKLKKYYDMPTWQESLKEFIQIWEENR